MLSLRNALGYRERLVCRYWCVAIEDGVQFLGDIAGDLKELPAILNRDESAARTVLHR
jgi:uncharacterized protein YutE (UPF0331/DUF86 family)